MKKIISILLFAFALVAVNAQEYRHSEGDTPANYKQIQQQFEQWSADKDLNETKGWKWYKRWEEHYKTRLNERGELVDPVYFLREASDYVTTKKEKRAADDSNWLPAGPDYVPQSVGSGAFHGIARVNCITFHPTNPAVFWIGASQGGVWKTSDGGESWTPLNDGLPILRISDITVNPANPDILYACLGDFEYNGVSLELDDRKRHTHYGLGLYKTIDGGLNWEPTGLTVFMEDLDYSLLRRAIINPNNPDELVAGGFEGLWRTTDAGETWTNVMEDLLISDLEQDENNPSVLYAASTYVSTLDEGNARIYKSVDFGATWESLNSGIPATGFVDRVELALAPSNSDVLYAITADLAGGMYAFYKSADGGANWTQQSDQNTPNILHWYEGTSSGGQGSYDLALVVDPNDENTVFAGGVNMWGTHDGGLTWDPASYWVDYYGPSLHADQHQFKYNPLNDRMYVANDGGVMYADEVETVTWNELNEEGVQFPTEWTNISDGMQITSFYRVGTSAADPDYIICGSQDNGTFYYNGAIWYKIIGGDGMNCILHPEDPGTLMGSYQYGSMVSSFNGGFSANYGVSDPILQNEEGEWTTPFFYHEGADRIYAGFGNMWYSTNWGDTWVQNSDFDNLPLEDYPAPASAIASSIDNPDAMYFARRLWYSQGTESEMWVSFLDGDDWEDVTEGLPSTLFFTDVVVDKVDPLMAWVTCSGFEDGVKVFRTLDGGQNWENMSFDLPNIPVNCIALDYIGDEHRLYLGTDLGIYTIADLETSWESFDANMPPVIVSDLDINPESLELYAATFGRGIWKSSFTPYIIDTDVEDVKIDFGMEVYPNPSNGIFNIAVDQTLGDKVTLSVIDILGKTVVNEILGTNQFRTSYELKTDLGSGVYYVLLQMGGSSETVKVVVE